MPWGGVIFLVVLAFAYFAYRLLRQLFCEPRGESAPRDSAKFASTRPFRDDRVRELRREAVSVSATPGPSLSKVPGRAARVSPSSARPHRFRVTAVDLSHLRPSPGLVSPSSQQPAASLFPRAASSRPVAAPHLLALLPAPPGLASTALQPASLVAAPDLLLLPAPPGLIRTALQSVSSLVPRMTRLLQRPTRMFLMYHNNAWISILRKTAKKKPKLQLESITIQKD